MSVGRTWTPEEYERHKERVRRVGQDVSISGRDITPLPEVVNPRRKKACTRDFRRYCKTYHPQTFGMPWGDDHKKVIGQIETAVLEGGLFATAMPRGSGKALALDTPLPTPSGWATMGEIGPGDLLFDETGASCRVIFATPIMEGRPCYRVSFDDGESVVCDADHLWTVDDRYSRRNPLILRTEDMATRCVLSTRRGWTEYRYSIPICGVIEGESPEAWAVSPYMLGVWLGDGTTTAGQVTIGDRDLEEMRGLIERHEDFNPAGRRKIDGRCGTYSVGMGRVLDSQARVDMEGRILAMTAGGSSPVEISLATGASRRTVRNIRFRRKGRIAPDTKSVSLATRLRWIGVMGDKHIPEAYLRASAEDRLELLRGLMDTDGSINSDGNSAEYVTKLPALRDGMMDLLAGLGFKRRCGAKVINDRPYYRISFAPTDGRRVFNLTRKSARQQVRGVRISATRRIVGIDAVASVPVRCIQVDSPNRLYLCGHGMVPTHNTSLVEAAAIWAILYGHRTFTVLIGSDEGNAIQMLESIKTELSGNGLLLEDFPEAIHPIVKLEGISHRCKGQIFEKKSTHIGWGNDEIVIATIPGSKASGAIIKVAGLTGGIRGLKHKRGDGETARPDLVLVDDPQTDLSARSPSQCQSRERILAGAILGLAGPRRKIAGLMPCTVIQQGDLADNMLDRDKHPEWNGTRTKMVYAFPSNEALWAEYARIRAESLRMEHGGREATAFYRKNRRAMDLGAVVAWPARHDPDELSAIQHAMNLRLRDERAFFAEYQNEPMVDADARPDDLTPDQVAAKLNHLGRGEVPTAVEHLTAFVDISGTLLWWMVCGWEDDFTGYVLDYGSFPDQKMPYYTLGKARHRLADVVKATGLEGQIFGGLQAIGQSILSREWERDDGATMKVGRALIDANWSDSTATVVRFCRQGAWSAVTVPSKGKYVGAAMLPMSEWQKRQGEKAGLNWKLGMAQEKKDGRRVVFDANFWKSFVHNRLSTAMGDRGCLSLFGDSPEDHRMLADQLCAEYRVRTVGRGRECDEWKSRPNDPDNHFLDCYSEDMETLTRDGWKLFSELEMSDELATVDLLTDLIEYQRPTALIARHHVGEMIQFGGGKLSRLDLMVTPTHRMVVFEGQSSRGPVIKEAGDLTIWDKIKTAASWAGESDDTFTLPATGQQMDRHELCIHCHENKPRGRSTSRGLCDRCYFAPSVRERYPKRSVRRHMSEAIVSTKDLAAFLGWYIAEGSCGVGMREGKGRSHKVTISQNPGPKQDDICSLLDKLPWKYHRVKTGVVIANEQVYNLVCDLGNKYTKRVPRWIKDASPGVIEEFLRCAVDGDGWRQDGSESYATVCRLLADDISELYLKTGHAVSMREVAAKAYCIRGRSGPAENCRTQYHVYRKKTDRSHLRDSRNKPNFRRIPYDGMVYCATVPNGTLIVRRNGKIAICGNCLAGNAVAASMLGAALRDASGEAEKPRRKRMTFAAMRARQAGRGTQPTPSR